MGNEGVISVSVVLFEKNVKNVELLNKDGTVVKELLLGIDYTAETGLADSTETYTFNNDTFKELISGETYTILFEFDDDTVSGYELYADEGLEMADKTTLIKKITEASGYIEIDYTLDSWETLEQALETALSVRDTLLARQIDVDAAADTLSEAINGLVKKRCHNI